MAKIFIDAGHGGHDNGAAGHNIKEKEVVLDVCNRIAAGLKEFECEVVQSRMNDTYLSLRERTDKANAAECDIFVSVHANASEASSAKGFESFRHPNAPQRTTALQNVLHEEIMKANKSFAATIGDRGKKTANFHVLRESKMSAVLTENLFISNAADAKLLANSEYRQQVAEGHVNGIVKFLGLRRIERPPQKPPTTKLYKVQVAAFSERSNAEAMIKTLQSEGFRPYLFEEDGFYKVQVGAYAEKENAEAMANELVRLGYKPFIRYE